MGQHKGNPSVFSLQTPPSDYLDPTVDPLALDPSPADTSFNDRRDRLSDLERATVADAELIHDCRWKAEAARQRIANRKAEIERLREAA